MNWYRFLVVSGRKLPTRTRFITITTPRYGAAGRAGGQGHKFVFFFGYFLRRLHTILIQCQSKTINIPNLAPIGRQVLLAIMAVFTADATLIF